MKHFSPERLTDPDSEVYAYLDDLRISVGRYVRAFALAVCVFCVVYFGAQEMFR